MGWWRRKKKKKPLNEIVFKRGAMLLEDLIECCDGKSNPIKFFSADEICKATDNFSQSNRISKFLSYDWYSGRTENHHKILIKKDCGWSKINEVSFCRDVAVSSIVSGHKNFRKLIGCCIEYKDPVMVYDGVKKHYQLDIKEQPWKRRMKIAEDIATALAYLHTAFPRPFVYRSMSLENLFLDEDGVTKLSDFSFCVSIPKGETFVQVDQIAGTIGYMEEKYVRTRVVSEPKPVSVANQNGSAMEEDEGDEEEDDPPHKKQKQLNSITSVAVKVEPEQVQASEAMVVEEAAATLVVGAAKKSKSKKKNNNVWVTKSTRKGKKKSKANTPSSAAVEDKVLITPVPRFPDKGDDTPDLEICLSKVYKAEKVEISEDRLTAGSSKGYRMVRATRGVVEGAWYFEIKVVSLGDTGHTRLGWSTDKGDLQAPVGYDGNSFGFRDIDGCKIHKALREKYAEEGYKEGDVIGFYINLPDGESFAPKPPHYVWYKGQRYICAPDAKEEPPKVVPGSEISFFKNGKCQGVAFKDIFGGRYYPAASMYTLPDQSNCLVKFNFGPDFEYFPEDFGGRATPKPMWEVPYHGFNGRLESNGSDDMKS